MMRQEIAAQPLLTTWDRLTDYLTAAMAHERTEQFRVLFLDGRNRLIADEVQGRGTINHAPAYPREVVRRCLELHATAVVLAHNHPSGEPSPSREDVALTAEIKRAAATMGITVHDHVIVGKGEVAELSGRKSFCNTSDPACLLSPRVPIYRFAVPCEIDRNVHPGKIPFRTQPRSSQLWMRRCPARLDRCAVPLPRCWAGAPP